MRVKNVLVLLLAAALIQGCNDSSESIETVDRAGTELKMPQASEIESLKSQALGGSEEAALRLSIWYMRVPNEADTFERWTRIAAENGSVVGQHNLGMFLLNVSPHDPQNKIRARFWLLRAAGQGSELARDQLARLDSHPDR